MEIIFLLIPERKLSIPPITFNDFLFKINPV